MVFFFVRFVCVCVCVLPVFFFLCVCVVASTCGFSFLIVVASVCLLICFFDFLLV